MKKAAVIFVSIAIFFGLLYYAFKKLDISPQGHGSRASYLFNSSKYALEKRIDSLIEHDQNIVREELYSNPNDNHYNTNGYFTIIIDSTSFCFRYYGDEKNWVSSPDKSEIFIAFIRDIRGQNTRTENECIELVEDKFVNKLVDKKMFLLDRKIDTDVR